MYKRKHSNACCDSHRCVASVRTAYNKLPKHGKPTAEEVTVLAAIVLKSADDTVSVVSLATGTKCIAHGSRQKDGTIVHDLHAEVLARRTAMYWVYQRLKDCLMGETPIGEKCWHDEVQTTLLSVMGGSHGPNCVQQGLSSTIRVRACSVCDRDSHSTWLFRTLHAVMLRSFMGQHL